MPDLNGAKVEQWMEARTLAEYLLPLLIYHDVKYRRHGLIYVDHQSCNVHTERRVLKDLSLELGVPVELVRSRLIGLGWLIDVRSASPVQNEVARFVGRLESQDLNDFELDEEDGQD
ncbi:hypothetical protein NLO88_27140 [Pseudomonas syringae]|nr:hypothetical protein [Pseudomonas syringae]